MTRLKGQIGKIVSVIGARPQFIKCAALSKELRKGHEEVIIHTGQHYDHGMSEIFFQELSIPHPDYNLNVGSNTQGRQTGDMLSSLEGVLIKERPDLVLVFGDTNSTLAGVLAASKLNMRIAHVEAGLRSFDRTMPEEINRVVADHLSNLLFVPTVNAANNLHMEGIFEGVHVVGDVMVDAVLMNLAIAKERSTILERLDLEEKDYLVATIHRQSNTDDINALSSTIRAMGRSQRKIVFPVHPRTRNRLVAAGMWEGLPSNIIPTEPLGYLDMLRLMSSADKIVTDSGGMQKEAYVLKVPCITVRSNTEWGETIGDGWNILVGCDPERLLEAISSFRPARPQSDPYGRGDAAVNIAKIIDGVSEVQEGLPSEPAVANHT